MRGSVEATAPSGNICRVTYRVVADRIVIDCAWAESPSKKDVRWADKEIPARLAKANKMNFVPCGSVVIEDSTARKEFGDQFLFGGGQN